MSLFNSLTSGGSQYAPKPFKRPSMGSSAPYMPTVIDEPRQGQSQIDFENEKRKLNHQRQMNNIFGYGHDGPSMEGSNQHMIGMGGRSKPVIGQPLRNTGGTNPSPFDDSNPFRGRQQPNDQMIPHPMTQMPSQAVGVITLVLLEVMVWPLKLWFLGQTLRLVKLTWLLVGHTHLQKEVLGLEVQWEISVACLIA